MFMALLFAFAFVLHIDPEDCVQNPMLSESTYATFIYIYMGGECRVRFCPFAHLNVVW